MDVRRAVVLGIGALVGAVALAYGGAWVGVRAGCEAALGADGAALQDRLDLDAVCGCAATGTLTRDPNPLHLFEAAWWAWGESERDRPLLSVASLLAPAQADERAALRAVLAAHRACLPPLRDLLPSRDEVRERVEDRVEQRVEDRVERRQERRAARQPKP